MFAKQHQRHNTFAGAFLLALALLLANTPALGQTLNPIPADPDSNSTNQKKVADADKEKRGSLVIAPIPISSPAFGSGLLLITAYVFKFDKEDAVLQVAPRQVFAYRGMGCSANGSVPFYDLCMFGFNSDLRGYTAGEF